jgi:Ras-related protein Rab-2A
VVYDITRDDSFDHIEDWNKEIENNADKDALVYLIGNMNDKQEERTIDSKVGQNKAEELGYKYFRETSAKTKDGIEELFIRAVRELLVRNKDRLNDFANNDNDEGNESQSIDPNQSDLLSEARQSVHLNRAKNSDKKKKK